MVTREQARADTAKAVNSIPNVSGVYLLKHRVTGDTYIGSAACMRTRVKQHLRMAEKNRCNAAITVLIRKHGIDFVPMVLAQTTARDRLRKEAELIALHRPTLNCQPFKSGAPVRDGRRAVVPISLTLTTSYLDLLGEVARELEGEPSISRLLDIALRQYLEAKGKLVDQPPKPRRK